MFPASVQRKRLSSLCELSATFLKTQIGMTGTTVTTRRLFCRNGEFDYEGGNVGEPFLTTQVPIGLLLNTEEITTHPVGVIALRLE